MPDLTGKVVKITGSSSIPEFYLGQYGIVKGLAYGDKWTIELSGKVAKKGSLCHTALRSDFEVIGVTI